MINFIRYNFLTALVSVALISGFIGFAVYRKQTTGSVFRYSIDFTGGAQVLLRFSKPVAVSAVQAALAQEGWSDAVLREFGNNEILVRIKLEQVEKEIATLTERIKRAMDVHIPDNQVTIMQSESVGPGVGESLRGKSAQAVLISLICMLIYIAVRFWSFGYALGTIISLFHDVIFMLAAFVILDREISINVIGAILAVIGYSMNDTIVIFSRIRDNVGKLPHESLANVINISINQTLRRTTLTSFATGLTVISMLVLGGEALRDFSLALLVGIIVGTYSSIFIASPVMMLFHRGKKA
jgi:preprotein translocase subunit SecF